MILIYWSHLDKYDKRQSLCLYVSLTNKTVILSVMCILNTYIMSDTLNEI